MTAAGISRRSWRAPLALMAGAVLIAIVIASWEPLTLGSAIATAERRPALLADADWHDPASARLFDARFRAGTPTADLLRWLTNERFVISAQRSHAERRLASLPCNERIAIDWKDGGGRLASASARVQEAGCL